MIIDPWAKHLKDKARKKAAKAWRKKKGLIKPPENKKTKKQKKPRHQKANNFYKSWEWKELRYEVIRERGNRCEACGTGPNDFGGRIVVDHILPVSKNPHLRLKKDNLQILCNDCNMGKSNKYTDDWRPETATPARHEDILEWLDE